MVIDHAFRKIMSLVLLAVIFGAGWMCASLYIGAKQRMTSVINPAMLQQTNSVVKPIPNPIQRQKKSSTISEQD